MLYCCLTLQFTIISSLSVIACLDGGRVDVPTMTQILQGRMKDQTTSHDELHDAFQVCQMCPSCILFYIFIYYIDNYGTGMAN